MRANPWALALLLGFLSLVAACGGKPKYPTCDGDKDCQNGERCIDKKCVQCGDDAHCPDGQKCNNGACEPIKSAVDTCTTDGDCGEGGRCSNGKCLRNGACNTDEDCPEDQDCINGMCSKPTAAPGACALDPVYFGFDQYTLDDPARTTLQKDFECLGTNQRTVAVVGMTDPRGTVEYNIGLSDDRAQAVITYLARLGIEPKRMRKVPKGSQDAKGVDESGYSKDRRVELTWE